MIGPAWRAMWRELADGEFHLRKDVIAVGVAAGGIQPKTASNLLTSGTKAGFLTRKAGETRYAPGWIRRDDRVVSGHGEATEGRGAGSGAGGA
jgi:hypothetical protein